MVNSIIVMGRLCRTPELQHTGGDGVPLTKFTIAVDRGYGGKDRQTDFFDCVAWRKSAEFISRYFSKGDMIIVRGEMRSRKYEDKYGNKRVAWEINVDYASFCGGKSDNTPAGDDEDGQSPYFSNRGESGENFDALSDDDLPFD